jgi:radical SAM superfamily enzyme YgiQ (UPF0313 family)
MRVCLITAPIIAEFADPDEVTSHAVSQTVRDPQLGILSLAAMLQARGEAPRIVDLNKLYLEFALSIGQSKPSEFADIAARAIAATKSDVYGFGSICSSYPLTIRIARTLKTLHPDSTVVFGGPQASVVDFKTLEVFPFVDCVLRGESEHTLLVLLEELGGNHRLDQVPGLTYRVGMEICRNPTAPLIENLDALPLPAYHLTTYLQGAQKADLELGRGCPFSCTFCSTNDFFRRRFRLRSPERVLRDMRVISTTYSIRDFELIHDMFTVDRRRVVEFCDGMIASGEGFTWSCSARTDCVDEDLLDLMARAGCKGIFYGIEVGSQAMQKVIDKHLNIERADKIIDATERVGIRSTVSLICGFPEETWEDIRETMRVYMHSARCAHSDPQLNLLAPLAETPLYSKHEKTLILEELCSDMSHQARTYNDADLKLIREHPDIFPNFYAIPTPHLDRAVLRELWEFALMGLARCRWLLVAIDQNNSGILDFFMLWRTHRVQTRPVLSASDLRLYYRTSEFRVDLTSFVRSQAIGDSPAVQAMLSYEDSLRQNAEGNMLTVPVGDLLSAGTTLQRDDIPVRRDRIVVFELELDIQRILDALKLKKEPVVSRGQHFYVTRPVSTGSSRIDRVSDWMASFLRLCDGRHSVNDVIMQLSDGITEVEKSMRGYVCMRLLEGSQAERLIDVYRPQL